jgi:hypothetical protein
VTISTLPNYEIPENCRVPISQQIPSRFSARAE